MKLGGLHIIIQRARSRYKTDDEKLILLEPVGDSPNLSEIERSSWDEWKTNILKLAKEFPEQIFINGQIEAKRVALSFDDAPDIQNTSEILNILDFYGIKASFSIVGVYLEELHFLLERIHSDGHTILNHTYNHPNLMELASEKIKEELKSAEDKIFEIIKKRTALVRPPFGSVDRRVMDVLEEIGYKSVIWSINTFDWLESEKHNIIKNAVENVESGDIILMHSYEDKEPTVKALPDIISRLLEKGYKFVTLDEMLGINPYKNN